MNEKFDQKINKYKFEILMEEVFSASKTCCENLESIIEEVFINKLGYTKNALINSAYVYFDEQRDFSLFHFERIIHQHISYIDSYRRYLINKSDIRSLAKINEIIINIIVKYINLLSSMKYKTQISIDLIEKLNVCVEYIKIDTNYNNKNIPISIYGYNKIKGRK